MLEVKFYDKADENEFRFAVIASRYQGKWVFCKHKKRDTWEMPGGTKEPGEPIDDTAKRELFEETGASEFHLKPICVYSVCTEAEETKGMLYLAEIEELGELPDMEIERIQLFDAFPENWTYPLIQPYLLEKVQEFISKAE